MSSIYINEPPTHGKVLLKTTFGDLDIELWSKEAPKACRNFVQLCMEGYYNNVVIHRIVKGLYAETGDPKGTGDTWDSIYECLFKDEIHSRLRFIRRGLIACIPFDRNQNGSQFLFTLGPVQEFTSKRTIFGKVAGDTLYNMLKLDSVTTDEFGTPEYPSSYKILKADILLNPFPDIIPREVKPSRSHIKKNNEATKRAKEIKAVKDFNLLSFGDEAIIDETESNIETKKYTGKGGSIHDVLGDKAFMFKTKSADGAVSDDDDESKEFDTSMLQKLKDKLKRKENELSVDHKKKNENNDGDRKHVEKERERKHKKKHNESKNEKKELKFKETVEKVSDDRNVENDRNVKIKHEGSRMKKVYDEETSPKIHNPKEDENSILQKVKDKLKRKENELSVDHKKKNENNAGDRKHVEKERERKHKKKHNERKELSAEYSDDSQKLDKRLEDKIKDIADKTKSKRKNNKDEDQTDYSPYLIATEQEKYKKLTKQLPRKGPDREKVTLDMLKNFKQKMSQTKDKEEEENTSGNDSADIEEEMDDDKINDVVSSGNWLSHQLKFKENVIHAKDANMKSDDWFDIYDPRNPINRRRRGEDTTKEPPEKTKRFK